MRANEVSVKVGDIDSTRMVIRVEQGEWRKDRYVMLSPNLLELRSSCWRAARPQGWLFSGQKRVNPLKARQLNRISLFNGHGQTPYISRAFLWTRREPLLMRAGDLRLLQQPVAEGGDLRPVGRALRHHDVIGIVDGQHIVEQAHQPAGRQVVAGKRMLTQSDPQAVDRRLKLQVGEVEAEGMLGGNARDAGSTAAWC